MDPTTDSRRAERGHIMAGVMVLLAIMLIFSTVVFQSWQDVLHRDNEAEMMFRAQELVRAMVRYRKDTNTTPLTLELLMEPGPKAQYYLRQLYKDPLVKDGKWGLLYAGPGGEIVDPNSAPGQGDDPFGRNAPVLGQTTVSGQQTGLGQRPVIQAPNSGLPTSDGAGGALDSEMAGGRVLTGMPIIGVKSLSKDDAFRVYKGQEEYSEWRFTIFDLIDPKIAGDRGRGGAGGGRRGGQFRQGVRENPGGRSKLNSGRNSPNRRRNKRP